MVKEKRILSYFIGWLLLGFIVYFIGVNKIFAATYYMNYQYQQQYYDNYGSSVNAVGTNWNDSFNSYISDNITTAVGSYGAGLSITSPIPLIGGHTYSMSVYFEDINNIALSSKNVISVASSLSASANDYANNIPGTEMLFSKVSNNTILQFVFKVDNNHTHIFFPWTTTSTTTQSYVLTQVVMEDLGSSGITENEINQSLNSQTNEINNSIQNSTDTITGEIDDMEQNIIDSNKETQDVIKDQFNECRDSINLWGDLSWSTATYSYFKLPKENVRYILAIKLKDGKTLPSDLYIGFSTYGAYNSNNNLKWVVNNGNFSGASKDGFIYRNNDFYGSYLNYISVYPSSYVNQLNDYFEIQLEQSETFTKFEEYGEICQNRIDETNDKLGDLNNSLNDSNVDGSLNNAGSFFDNFSTTDHGGLSGIITAPLVAINQMLNTSCNPMTTNFKGKELSLPCGYDFWNRLGAIQDFVNIVLGGMLCYRIIIKLYKLIERIKNPEDDRLEVMDL